MIDGAIIKGVTEIANARIYKDFPCYSNHHFNEIDVKLICEVHLELSKMILDNQLAKSKMVEAEFGNMVTGKFNEGIGEGGTDGTQ